MNSKEKTLKSPFNIEIHNVSEMYLNDNGSYSWLRVPSFVYEKMESEQGKKVCKNSTGVELRFVMKSDTVTLRMRVLAGNGIFHVYRGSIQGGFEDHEKNKVAGGEFSDFIIKKSENMDMLNKITKDFGYPFSPEVVRVIFDRGSYELLEIIGDVEPPTKEQLPPKTLLGYGSSITHGSNSIDRSHSWLSVLAHNLKMDCINLGMAGSCLMEPELIEWIASEGEKGKWDTAILELGINVLTWKEEKIAERVKNALIQIAGRNQNKQIYVISPLYSMSDYNQSTEAEKWRKVTEETVNTLNYHNVKYINGLVLLGDMSLVSADGVHPNIYGIAQISEKLTAELKGKADLNLQ